MEKVKPLHTITPRIESPLADADHEKDAVDPLFELFFIIVVTALEVFFAYRWIGEMYFLLAYQVQFSLAWANEYHHKLSDVPLVGDSVFGRVYSACKAHRLAFALGLGVVVLAVVALSVKMRVSVCYFGVTARYIPNELTDNSTSTPFVASSCSLEV